MDGWILGVQKFNEYQGFSCIRSHRNKDADRLGFGNLPLQLTPSPVKPTLQLHSNEPGLFTQSAFDEQLLAPGEVHSSISARYLILHLLFKNFPL